MTTPGVSWADAALAGLLRHLGAAVRGLLPAGLEISATGLELALVRRGPDGASHTVRSLTARPPTASGQPPTAEVAAELLVELQQQVGRHLGRPWPNNRDGVALYAETEQVGTEIRMHFVGRGSRADSTPIELAPFTLPTDPTRN